MGPEMDWGEDCTCLWDSKHSLLPEGWVHGEPDRHQHRMAHRTHDVAPGREIGGGIGPEVGKDSGTPPTAS